METCLNRRIAGAVRVAVIFGVCGAFGVICGCGHNDEPLPPVAVSGTLGPPVSIRPERMPSKSALTVNLTETPQDLAATAATSAGPAESPVAVDTSSPEATVRSFIEMMSTGQLAQLPQVFSPEYQELANGASQSLGPLLQSEARAREAWSRQFPDTPPFTSSGESMQMTMGSQFADQLEAGKVEMSPSQDGATVALVATDGQEKARMNLTRVEDAWLIDDPKVLDLPENPQEREMMFGMVSKMVGATDEFTNDLAAGNFADPEQAMAAFGERIGPIMMEAIQQAMRQGGPEGGSLDEAIDLELDLSPPGGDNTTTPPAGETARPPRDNDSNDPVGGTYSGPGMLRAR